MRLSFLTFSALCLQNHTFLHSSLHVKKKKNKLKKKKNYPALHSMSASDILNVVFCLIASRLYWVDKQTWGEQFKLNCSMWRSHCFSFGTRSSTLNTIMSQMASNQQNGPDLRDRHEFNVPSRTPDSWRLFVFFLSLFFTFGDSQSLLFLGEAAKGGFESLWHHLLASRREEWHVPAVQVYWGKKQSHKS